MKHLARIQAEFLKEARKWDDLTLEEQRAYLERHPASRRKLTAKPKPKSKTVEHTEAESEDIKLTKVQQEVFDACEPLIKDLQDRAERHLDTILSRFEEYKKQQAGSGDVEAYKFMKDFAHEDQDTLSLLNSVYRKKQDDYSPRSPLKNFSLDEKRKQAYYNRVKDEIKEYNVFKLSRALHRYVTSEFKDIKNIHITRGANGFEVSANLIDDQDRQWNFNTRAISAGGYNIQVWHYRYIISLSSPEVPREVVRQRLTEKEKLEKETRKQERLQEHKERLKLKNAKKIASVFQEIKGKIKSWDEWQKQILQERVAKGDSKQEELDQREKEITRFKDFIRKYNYKRQELTDKILNGEMTLSTFDEVKDLLLKDDYDFYGYRQLKRQESRGEL